MRSASSEGLGAVERLVLTLKTVAIVRGFGCHEIRCGERVYRWPFDESEDIELVSWSRLSERIGPSSRRNEV